MNCPNCNVVCEWSESRRIHYCPHPMCLWEGSTPLWIKEHGPEFQVPAEIDQLVNEGKLQDASWHNDTSPRFFNATQTLELWVNHPDPEQREMPGPRFTVGVHDDEDPNFDPPLYEGEDLKTVLEYMLQ